MATPRKHWFRVEDAIQYEDWPLEVVGLAVKLMAYLNTRWAREGLTAEGACHATLTPEALLSLTVSRQVTRAERVLDALVTRSSLVARKQSGSYELFWPKFAEKQGLRSPETPRKRPETSPSAPAPAPAPAGREEQESEPAAPGSAPPPKRQARAVAEVPSEAHAFAQDFRDALVKVHAGFKPPSANAFERWRQEARLLLAADERPPEEARDLASWLFTDPGEEAAFWRANVLSVQKFRQKYDQLRAQKQRAEERRRGAAHRGSTLLALAYT